MTPPPLRRRPDWLSAMMGEIEGARGRSFHWGRHDCVTFAGDVVAAMTGEDLIAAYRGRYGDAHEAARILVAETGLGYGAGGLEALAARVCADRGCVEVPPLMAHRGDLLYRPHEADGEALGICVGPAGAFPHLTLGVVLRPLAEASRAWRIGG